MGEGGGVEPHVARVHAGRMAGAEADPEGGLEIVGGVETVLAFEDRVAEARETARDPVDIGIRRARVRVEFGGVEDHFAAGRVAREAVQVFVAEGAPITLGLPIEFVQVSGNLGTDAFEIGATPSPDHNGATGGGGASEPFGKGRGGGGGGFGFLHDAAA